MDHVRGVDVYISGSHCEPFSDAGMMLGLQDPRARTYYDQFMAIAPLRFNDRPKVCIAENVVGVLSVDKGMAQNMLLKMMSDIGYTGYEMLLDSRNYGSIECRVRLYTIFARADLCAALGQFPVPKHSTEPPPSVHSIMRSMKERLEEQNATGEQLVFDVSKFQTVDIQRDFSHQGIEFILEGKEPRVGYQWRVSSPDKASRTQRAKGANPSGLTTQGGHVVAHMLDEAAEIVGFTSHANTGKEDLQPTERREAIGGVMNVCTLQALSDSENDYFTKWDAYVESQETACHTSATCIYRDAEVVTQPITSSDVKAEMEEDVWIRLPAGVELTMAKNPRMLRVLRALYGCPNSPQPWNKNLTKVIEGTLGFTRLHFDSCLYHYVDAYGTVLISVSVDDLVITGDNKRKLAEIETFMKKEWYCTQYERVSS